MNPTDPNLQRVELVVLHHRDFDNTLPGLVVYAALYDSRIETVRHRITTIANLRVELPVLPG